MGIYLISVTVQEKVANKDDLEDTEQNKKKRLKSEDYFHITIA